MNLSKTVQVRHSSSCLPSVWTDPNSLPNSIRRNMARALLQTREFKSIDISRALGLPDMVCAGFLAAETRRGAKVLQVRE